MNRRAFMAGLGGAATWPIVARAQRGGQIPRLGVLMNGTTNNSELTSYMAAFTNGFRNLGWKEGQNVHIDLRYTAGDSNLIKSYAAELVNLAPNVLLSSSTSNLKALLRETQTIPIIFVQVSDSVAQGFVPNLVHPGGNITGFAAFEFSMGGKWLDLLKQIAPNLTHVAIIFNPDTSPQSKYFQQSIEAAGPSFNIQVNSKAVHTDADIEAAITDTARQPNSGLIFPTDSFTQSRGDKITDLAALYRLPAVYPAPSFAENGGLMTYQVAFKEQFEQAASYVDRVLKGAKPGDLPVQLATNYRLIINQKAARAIGIDMPMGLTIRADKVIE
jgi:putative tryptophan/tyrosine transport system substrate-binding protein